MMVNQLWSLRFDWPAKHCTATTVNRPQVFTGLDLNTARQKLSVLVATGSLIGRWDRSSVLTKILCLKACSVYPIAAPISVVQFPFLDGSCATRRGWFSVLSVLVIGFVLLECKLWY
jgi:hypothetical protein